MIIHSEYSISKKQEGLNVKTTIVSRLGSIIAPDYCCGCGKVGGILCLSCRNDIVSEPFGRCLSCLSPTSSSHLCGTCQLPYKKAWTAGFREDILQQLVNISKFESNRRGCRAQAELLDGIVDNLPEGTIITSVPTIAAHIRQRGFDHCRTIARSFAGMRKLPYRELLSRQTNAVQHGAPRSVRIAQAKQAFTPIRQLELQGPVLLIDDVYTTGATLKAAASCLAEMGAKEVWVAVSTRQPIDLQ